MNSTSGSWHNIIKHNSSWQKVTVILILLNKQLLTNFLDWNVCNFKQLFKNFGATFKKIWSKLWLRQHNRDIGRSQTRPEIDVFFSFIFSGPSRWRQKWINEWISEIFQTLAQKTGFSEAKHLRMPVGLFLSPFLLLVFLSSSFLLIIKMYQPLLRWLDWIF